MVAESKNRFQKNLKSLMLKRELSAVDLASAIGISHAGVYGWLNGRTMANPDQLDALSKALNCDIQDLFRKKPGITKQPKDLAKELFKPEDHLKALGEALGFHVTLRKKKA